MQSKIDILLNNIRKKMTRFSISYFVQNKEMDDGLEHLKNNYLENKLSEQDEYFIGRFALNGVRVPLLRHLCAELQIDYNASAVLIKSSRDYNYVKVFLSGKAIELYLNQPDKELINSNELRALDNLCDRIDSVMIKFDINSHEKNIEQLNGLNKIKDNFSSNKINSQLSYFVGRFDTNHIDLQQKISAQMTEDLLMKDGYASLFSIYFKAKGFNFIQEFISEQIGFTLVADDLIIEQSTIPNNVKVFLKSEAISKVAGSTYPPTQNHLI